MPLTKGRATYTRFRVVSCHETPKQIDTAFLSTLADYRFREAEIGTPEDIEAGFVTAEHLLDTNFTPEKIVYNGAAFFALRIDTHKVPSEIKRAHQKLNEQVSAESNPTGFASKAQKREACELAQQHLQDDLAAGKFRRSSTVEIAWPFGRGEIYLGSTSGTAIEQFVRLMRTAFLVELRPITPGTMAEDLLHKAARPEVYQDLLPSPFTSPPARTHTQEDRCPTTPICPWVIRSTDLKDFLGNEFLMWLWYLCEREEGIITAGKDELFFAIAYALDMSCAWELGGKQTLRADKPTALAEAHEALVTGKWPMKMGLILSDGEDQYELRFTGEALGVSAVRLPSIDDAQTPRDVITQRLALIYKLTECLDQAYTAFLHERTNPTTWASLTKAIASWIKTRN